MSRWQPGKYLPLCAWLEALPSSQTSAVLGFAEIERLIGAALPTSAWLRAFWTSSDTAKQNWQRTGFTAHLDSPGPRVAFTRTAGEATRSTADAVS